MTKDKFKELIDEYEFKRYADIVASDQGCVQFCNHDTSWTGVGYVYLWVEESENDLRIVYVGKAGGSMRDRCNQHFGGFKGGSGTGQKHSGNIIKGLSAGKTYHVYARKSPTCTIHGVEGISRSCIEEIAFIEIFKCYGHLWNS